MNQAVPGRLTDESQLRQLDTFGVRARDTNYLLLDIFHYLRLETWKQWTIKAAHVKVQDCPFSFLRMVQWCIRQMRLTLVFEVTKYRLVQV